MGSSQFANNSVDQLKNQLAINEDIVAMMNKGVSKTDIANKYGFSYDSTKMAVNKINLIKEELVSRGEVVQGYTAKNYNFGKNAFIFIGAIVLLVVAVGVIGKFRKVKK